MIINRVQRTYELEAYRVQNLLDYKILDTQPEVPFNNLAAILTEYFRVPIALINFVDSERVWVKATKYGDSGNSVTRANSICSHAIKNNSITVYEDTLKFSFLKDIPLVTGEPKIRFYAAAPITTFEGFNIGVVCIADMVPRTFSREKLQKLKVFADQVRKELERRLEIQE